MATAASSAAPRNDISSTARLDPAEVSSNSVLSLPDSTGNALMTIGMASTA